MDLLSDEIEVLNRAMEVLSKYADCGSINRDSFELFKRLLISAIDSPASRAEVPRETIKKLPFSRLLLSYIFGYYDNKGKQCFYGASDLINVEFGADTISFEILSEETKRIFKSFADFTLAPTLVTVMNNRTHILHLPSLLDIENKRVSVKKAEKVNAPYMASFPIILECRIVKMEQGFSSRLDAQVLRTNVSKSVINGQGELDIINNRMKMMWVQSN